MNGKGTERLLSSKYTLGGDVSVAAGPVGRQAGAETDALMSAEVPSYSQSRGSVRRARTQGHGDFAVYGIYGGRATSKEDGQ
jgi:SH3 domain-containing YSC84-like protein 1